MAPSIKRIRRIQERLRQIQFADQEQLLLLKKRQREDEKQAALLRQRQEETAKLEAAESSLKNLGSQFPRTAAQSCNEGLRTESTELKSAHSVRGKNSICRLAPKL